MEAINNLPSPSILIIEDDEDDIFILKEGFDDLEFGCIRFYTDAPTAIDYLNSLEEESLPTLIVTDFNLPAVNGFQFVKFLKTHPKLSNLTIVVLTTSVSAMNRQLFLDEGVTEVILKPNAFDDYKRVAKTLKDLAEQSSKLQRLGR